MLSLILAFQVVAAPAHELHARVDSLFASWHGTQTPGCAVGVFRDGRVEYANGYGMADLASGTPILPATVFGLASLSKHFTAFAVLLLVEEGRIDLDAAVQTYLPELPAYGVPMRVRDLLHHTSGLRDYLSMVGIALRDAEGMIPRAAALDLITRQRGLNAAPGTQSLYSNTNYFLLGDIIERVTGQTLDGFARSRMFDPLGMRTARYALPASFTSGQAESYRIQSDHLVEVQMSGGIVGDGGMYASIDDIARWEAHFFAPSLGRDPRALLARFREDGRYADGRAIGYGWGTQFSTYRGARTEAHGGTWGGFRTYYLRVPAHAFATAVLCNQLEISPFQLTRRIVDVYLGDRLEAMTGPPPAPVTPAAGPAATVTVTTATDVLRRYAGSFSSAELDVTYTIATDSGGLQLRSGLSEPQRLDIVHADTLQWRGSSVRLVVRRDAGSVTGYTLNSGRVMGVLLKREPDRPPH